MTLSMLWSLLLLAAGAGAGAGSHTVDLGTETDWYCRTGDGRYWWPGQSLDSGCYSYQCTSRRGIKRA